MSDHITITAVESDTVRKQSIRWFQKTAFGPIGWRLYLLWSMLILVLAYLGAISIGTFLNDLAGGPVPYPVDWFISLVVAALIYQLGCSHITRKLHSAHKIPQKGPSTFVFQASGIQMADNLREWSFDWRYVSQATTAKRGLFLATAGTIFYISRESWTTEDQYMTDTARILSWWRTAKDAQT